MTYSEMPPQQWDGKTPLVLFNDDKFFYSEDDIEYYLEDINSEIENSNNYKKVEDLQLCIASPNYLWVPDFNDIYIDIMPEDQYLDGIISKDLKKAFDLLEEAIRHEPPVSWGQGKFRVILTP
jgi:hypothetical protein